MIERSILANQGILHARRLPTGDQAALLPTPRWGSALSVGSWPTSDAAVRFTNGLAWHSHEEDLLGRLYFDWDEPEATVESNRCGIIPVNTQCDSSGASGLDGPRDEVLA